MKDEEGTILGHHFGDICCCQGKVEGIRDYNLPPTLKKLYTEQDSDSKYFRNKIRTFNNGMAMCSLTTKWVYNENRGPPYVVTCQGELHRRVGPLLFGDKRSIPLNTNTYVQEAQGHHDSKLRIFSYAEVVTVYFQLGRGRTLIFAKSQPQIRA